MGRFSPVCGIICILLILWTEKIQSPAVDTQPESNICVLRTRKGVDIRASLKPSLRAQNNFHQNLDLSNARCCFNPDKKCALPRHLTITLNNITSLSKYPIHPLWMVVNNKRIPHLGVWDELWYSLYEFEEPSLTQSVDVEITRKTSFNAKEAFLVHLSSDKMVSPPTHTENSARLVITPHRSPVREEDRILNEDVFLMIPEVTDNMKKDSQTRRGPRDYLVLNQSLFEFPNSHCFNEKTRFMSLVDRQHRPCVEASSVDLDKQPYDFYVKGKVKENYNEPTEFFLSSFGTLKDTETTSRHRSSVVFISQQPLILHIFIPNEEPSSRLTAAAFLNTAFVTITLYSRHLGSFLNDQCTLVMTIIRHGYDIISEYSDILYSSYLGAFLNDLGALLTVIIRDGYDVIAHHFQLLATFLKVQWSSAVGVLYSAAEQLCDLLGSFDKFDRISFEKSIDYQWNLIWSYVDHACQEIKTATADVDATMAAGWTAFSILTVFPALLFKWLVTSLRNPVGVPEMDDIIMLDNNDSGTFVFGRDDLLADYLEEAFNIMVLPPWTGEDDTMVDGKDTVIVGQDTVLQRSVGIPLTPSDRSLTMDIAYDDDDQTFLCLSVSDSCISYDFETARSSSYRRARSVVQCISDNDIMYLSQRRTETGFVETPRDLPLLTETASDEHYHPLPLRSFSVPSISPMTAIEEYQNDGDDNLNVRNGSSHDLMSVTHRETKTRVEGPPTGKLTPVLNHSKEDPSVEDLDEAYEGYVAPKGRAVTVFQEDEELRVALKNFLSYIDDTYGKPETTTTRRATHFIKQKPSGEDINMAQNNDAPELSQEYKLDEDVKQALKKLITDVDKDYGNNKAPRQRATHFLWQCQEVMFYVLRVYMDNRFY